MEICDGKDNDCDGETDELTCVCINGETRPCGSNIGICEYGTSTCTSGNWGSCEGGVKPDDYEICGNNLDDDCDGYTDEDCENILDACSNGIQDGNEEGVDCGGNCPNPCPDNSTYYYIIAGIGVVMIITSGIILTFVKS